MQYAGEMLILAEALGDPEAVATALSALGTGYTTLGAHRGGVILLESGAEIAREHHLAYPLARALHSLAALLNCRDLTASLRHAQECAEVARRAGLQALGRERRGQLRDRPVVRGTTQPSWPNSYLRVWTPPSRGSASRGGPWTSCWLTPSGKALPPPLDETAAASQSDLAWRGCADLTSALAAGDAAEVTRIAPLVLNHALGLGRYRRRLLRALATRSSWPLSPSVISTSPSASWHR